MAHFTILWLVFSLLFPFLLSTNLVEVPLQGTILIVDLFPGLRYRLTLGYVESGLSARKPHIFVVHFSVEKIEPLRGWLFRSSTSLVSTKQNTKSTKGKQALSGTTTNETRRGCGDTTRGRRRGPRNPG